jgi:hypothetical protein
MRFVLRAALMFALSAATAQAQAPSQPRDPNMPDPKNVPAEKMAPPLDRDTTGSTGGTLSDRLEQTEGVIRPPSTATPDMTVKPPVPNPNSTPVIPPPGASPADPIQPK